MPTWLIILLSVIGGAIVMLVLVSIAINSMLPKDFEKSILRAFRRD